jgi:SHS2 domain-containing protein
MKFKYLEHTADVKFQSFGNNVEKVFENSALALKESICGKIKIKDDKERIIKVRGKDFESLLYNFLEEIVYLLEAENFIISKIDKMEIKNFKLKAIIIGDKASDYKFNNEVKAVTYNEMFVKQKGKKWISQVVLDV